MMKFDGLKGKFVNGAERFNILCNYLDEKLLVKIRKAYLFIAMVLAVLAALL